jgi:hypothetical protein
MWDLIERTARRLVTRKQSNVFGEPRFAGLLPLLPTGGSPPALLEKAVLDAAQGRERVADRVWRNALILDSEETPPPGPTPPAGEGEDEDGGISLLVIEVAGE